MEYALSQVVWVIKNTFDEFFGEFQFWCTAEVLSCKTVGKNTYIELWEYDEDNTIIAKMRGNIFKPWLIENFFRETNLDRTTLVGQKILFQWRVSYHKDYGISLLINLLSSTYTLGLAQQTQNAIIQTLAKEWVLSRNKEKVVASKPLSLAVISGETSAWLQDFLQILDDAQIVYNYTLFQATVQWNSAKEAVYNQLQNITAQLQLDPSMYDMVCLVRGWGESGGIVWQNDIDIARTICHMYVPVIVAIGHTQDVSVLETIAWKFAKTPSEAAFYILQHYRDIMENVIQLYEESYTSSIRKIQQYHSSIQEYYNQITIAVPRIIQTYKERIESIYSNIYAYHPVWLLKKWYAIVRDASTWQILWVQSMVDVGTKLTIQTATQQINATVDSVATKA